MNDDLKKNSRKSKLALSIVGLGLGLASPHAIAAPDWAKDVKTVKCLGVAKKGMNDCGNVSKTHTCSGKAVKDNDPGEWVYTPEALCEKLANGKVWKK